MATYADLATVPRQTEALQLLEKNLKDEFLEFREKLKEYHSLNLPEAEFKEKFLDLARSVIMMLMIPEPDQLFDLFKRLGCIQGTKEERTNLKKILSAFRDHNDPKDLMLPLEKIKFIPQV